MDPVTRKLLDNLFSGDATLRYEAFMSLISITSKPVDWTDEIWDDLLAMLHSKE